MTDAINWHPLGTPGPFYVGAQNDALYIIAGRAPSMNNDYPWHEAPRVAVARVFEPSVGVCLPINASANARAIAEVPAMVVALRELADDLESELQSRYAPELVVKYAHMKRRFDRDMALVTKARAILSRIDGGAA